MKFFISILCHPYLIGMVMIIVKCGRNGFRISHLTLVSNTFASRSEGNILKLSSVYIAEPNGNTAIIRTGYIGVCERITIFIMRFKIIVVIIFTFDINQLWCARD